MRDKIQQIREKALAEIDKADGLEKLSLKGHEGCCS
mgnify:CR=1 FL=1